MRYQLNAITMGLDGPGKPAEAHMMDGMGWGMGWFGLLVLILIVLGIAALVKYLLSDRK